MAYMMFTLWIAATIVSLILAYLLLRVLYPKEEEEEEEPVDSATGD